MNTPEHITHPNLEGLLIQSEASGQQSLALPSSKRLLGLLLLFLCVGSSVIQVEIVQFVQSSNSYDKPYFILWLAHSSFILLMPIYLSYSYMTNKRSLSYFRAQITTALHSLYDSSATATTRNLTIKLMVSSLWFSVPYTLAAYLWYIAASLTTPARLTAAYNTTACFAYVFEIHILGETWQARKMFAVLLAVAGVVFMSLLSTVDQSTVFSVHAIAGDIIGLLSAACTGFVEVVYKKQFVPKTGASMTLANTITALMGFSTFLVLWIPLAVLNFTDIEKFELPDKSQAMMITVNAIFGVIYNSSFMPMIALMGPVWAAVGIMLSIPAVSLVDLLLFDRHLTLPVIFGSALVMVAFWLLMSGSHTEPELQDKYKVLTDGDSLNEQSS